MAQEQTAIRERQKTRLKEPGRYVVMMFNDDFTPMDFVVEILESIFFKSQAEAEAIMLKVHHEEKAVVGTYSYDIAKSKVEKAMEKARTQKYPLKLTYMPVMKALILGKPRILLRKRKEKNRMDSMGLTRYMSVLMDDAMKQARFFDHEFVMPEHMLLALLSQYAFCQALQEEGVDSPQDARRLGGMARQAGACA